MNFNYYMPTKILFGRGKLNALETESLPGKKALIVISGGTSMKKNGYLDRLTAILTNRNVGYAVFDKILPNPIKSHVMEGAALAKKEGCDFVIGLGGGSSIDSSKSIAIMATNPGDYWDYIIGGSGKEMPLVAKPLPIVAITTTAGTGTEADPFTVITKEDTSEKIGYGADSTFPVLSIVDPDLMLTVPEKLTAYQGFDALFHSAEGYINRTANPISDMFAIKAIRLIFENLPLCIKDGSNVDARTNLALANTLAGFVECNSGCTSEHSMEHAMSANHHALPHGAGLIMLSEAYFTFFADVVPDRMTAMAKTAGVDTDSLSESERPLAFVKALLDLQQKCGVHDLKMSDYGITKDEIPELAKKARDTMGGLFDVDPRETTLEETTQLMANAFK